MSVQSQSSTVGGGNAPLKLDANRRYTLRKKKMIASAHASTMPEHIDASRAGCCERTQDS